MGNRSGVRRRSGRFDPALRILGEELSLDDRPEFRREAACEDDRIPAIAELQADGEALWVGLVDRGQRLVHVEGASLVRRRDREGDTHGHQDSRGVADSSFSEKVPWI
jgi:hypothetical protein